jgi:hypothetical protein
MTFLPSNRADLQGCNWDHDRRVFKSHFISSTTRFSSTNNTDINWSFSFQWVVKLKKEWGRGNLKFHYTVIFFLNITVKTKIFSTPTQLFQWKVFLPTLRKLYHYARITHVILILELLLNFTEWVSVFEDYRLKAPTAKFGDTTFKYVILIASSIPHWKLKNVCSWYSVVTFREYRMWANTALNFWHIALAFNRAVDKQGRIQTSVNIY